MNFSDLIDSEKALMKSVINIVNFYEAIKEDGFKGKLNTNYDVNFLRSVYKL